ncbi:MAG: GHKL domain-containing protein [Lewinellaceae bacterium]|nr:GHKL domain-containing protein [Lewinellaceae bacterium]
MEKLNPTDDFPCFLQMGNWFAKFCTGQFWYLSTTFPSFSLPEIKQMKIRCCLSICLIILVLPSLEAQDIKVLLKGLDTAQTPKSKIEQLVKIADAYAAKKDFQHALEYRARAYKLNDTEKAYPYNDEVLTGGFKEKVFDIISLENLKQAMGPLPKDLETAPFLNQVAKNVINSFNSEYAIELAEKALNLSIRSGDKLQEARSYFYIGNAYDGLKNFNEALPNLYKSYELAAIAKDTVGIIMGLVNYARVCTPVFKLKEAERAFGQALDIATIYSDKIWLNECLRNLRVLRYYQGDFRKARQLDSSILKLAYELRDTGKIEMARWDEGMTLLHMGNFREALPLFLSSMKSDEMSKRSADMPQMCFYVGLSYQEVGSYDSALVYFHRSIDFSQQYNSPMYRFQSFQQITLVYFEMGDTAKAFEYADRVNGVFPPEQIEKNIHVKSEHYKWLATFFEQTGQLDSAAVYTEKLLDIAEKNNMQLRLAGILSGLGELNLKMGKTELAKGQLERCLELSKELGIHQFDCKAMIFLSELAIGQGRYQQAIKYLDESLGLAIQLNQTNVLKDIYAHLVKAHSKVGNFKEAFVYQTKLVNLKDSLLGFEQKDLIAKYDAIYQVKEKGLENGRLQLEKEKKEQEAKNLKYGLAATIFVLVLLSLAAFNIYKIAQKNRRLADELGAANQDLKLFSYSLAHDIQGYITDALNYSFFLDEPPGALRPEKEREFMSKSRKKVQALREFCSDLISYARMSTDELPPQATDLNEVLAEVCASLEQQINSVGAKIDIQEGLPKVTVHHARMVQLFSNLIDNAIKFHREDETLEVGVTCEQKGNDFLFTVSDNGQGIPPERQGRIFDLFVKGSSGGSGIGLAVCKRVVEGYGGKIWVQSEVGSGTHFYFTYPT